MALIFDIPSIANLRGKIGYICVKIFCIVYLRDNISQASRHLGTLMPLKGADAQAVAKK